jgi:rubrerythrin
MDLGTFGAILRFAIDWEDRAAAFYEQTAQGDVEVLFQDLARGSRRRLRRLEQARREGIAEMILEPITGLDGDTYRVELDPGVGEAGLVRQARALEEMAACFYQDAAAKLPIREVSRLFGQLAQENRQRGERLHVGTLVR